jgi:hypothetical protein
MRLSKGSVCAETRTKLMTYLSTGNENQHESGKKTKQNNAFRLTSASTSLRLPLSEKVTFLALHLADYLPYVFREATPLPRQESLSGSKPLAPIDLNGVCGESDTRLYQGLHRPQALLLTRIICSKVLESLECLLNGRHGSECCLTKRLLTSQEVTTLLPFELLGFEQ